MTVAAPTPVVETLTDVEAPRQRRFLRRFLRRKLGVAAVVYLVGVIVCCLFASHIAPYPSNAQDLTAVYAGPSLHHLLGTDNLGRDVLSRLLFGGITSLVGVAEVVGIALVIGVSAGLRAGYRGGWSDGLLSRLADLGLAIPAILVLLMVLAVFSSAQWAAMGALGLLVSPAVFRVVRASALTVRNELSVRAGLIAGISHTRILVRHILPRTLGPLIVNCSVIASAALITQAGLNYLGLGVQAPAPSWGGMVATAQAAIQNDSWLLVPAGGIIGLTVVAFVLLGDALRDSLVASSGTATPVPATTARQLARVQESGPPAGRDWPADHSALCSVRKLSVTVPSPAGELTVVEDVGFDIHHGEAVGLVGESGCGKTMTALALLGLLPPGARVAGGECWFEGRDLVAMDRRSRARLRGREIGFVSQDPFASLDPSFTVGRQVAELVRRLEGVSRATARARAVELFDMVRLPRSAEVARMYAHQISGGMAQRVSIAAAIAGRPRLLIADEPTTALDVTVQAGILSLLRELQREQDMGVLLISHDWGVVSEACDRAVVVYAGQVVEQDEVAQLVSSPHHPYTMALLDALPQRARPGTPLPTIAGTVLSPADWPVGCHFAPRCRFATAECRAAAVPLEREGDAGCRCVRQHERELQGVR